MKDKDSATSSFYEGLLRVNYEHDTFRKLLVGFV